MILTQAVVQQVVHCFWDCPNRGSKFVSCNQIYLQIEQFVWWWWLIFTKLGQIFQQQTDHLPAAIVLTTATVPSRNTGWVGSLQSPSIFITSCLVFGLPKRSNTRCRELLDSKIRPPTSLIGRRKYLWIFFSMINKSVNTFSRIANQIITQWMKVNHICSDSILSTTFEGAFPPFQDRNGKLHEIINFEIWN